ncbi:RNA recognition motif aka RRM, RBD, or RNP domain-containing protein isoform 2 [Cladophialophora immunda]|nr:RNA recognition motif aka RRM, RBD, or RNP domain-containing protein isoform 2 [Cladophialophora immunda]
MPQRQERHRPRHASKDEQPYIILVHDIPRHCRWQELKDMTRSLGGEQSLKAEVFTVSDGSQLGHCTIKGRADAVKVYENLCTKGWNGYRVRVKLVAQEKDGSLTKIEGPEESNGIVPSERPAGLSHAGLQGPTAIAQHSVNPLFPPSALPPPSMSYTTQYATMTSWTTQPGVPSLTPTLGPTAASHSSGVGPPRPSYLPPSIHGSTIAPPTPYSTHFPSDSRRPPSSPTAPLPVRRVNDGSKIFISGLPYYQSESELRGLLKRYGHVIYLEIHPDSRNPGKNKGTARARYKSASEALSAVRDLDGRYLSNRKISVKQEKDEPSTTTTTTTKNSSSGSSRSDLQETKNGSGSSKQKKSAAFSSKASSSKSRRRTAAPVKEPARGQSRANRQRSSYSSGSTSPTGPLVVNGASRSSTRRGSWGEESTEDSDDSSDDAEGSDEGFPLADDDDGVEEEEENDDDDDDSVQKMGGMHRRGRL